MTCYVSSGTLNLTKPKPQQFDCGNIVENNLVVVFWTVSDNFRPVVNAYRFITDFRHYGIDILAQVAKLIL